MLGVSVVGLSGSMIKESTPHELPGKESFAEGEVPKPEATTVLVGVFFIIFAQILYAYSLTPPKFHTLILILIPP